VFAQRPLDRRRFFGTVALSMAAAWIGTRDSVLQLITVEPFRISGAKDLASLGRATAWLNSAPLTADGLRGKVVLVDFWTYTCINWLRTLPHVRAWAARYKEYGLVVLGVHTPEFSFEEDIDNVRRSIKAMGIEYPIAVDNDRAIWRGFANHYWPALYFVDSTGQVQEHHFGEGKYEQLETKIRQLLTGAGNRVDGPPAQRAAVVGSGSTRRSPGTADTTAQERERARRNRDAARRDPLRGTPGRRHRAPPELPVPHRPRSVAH
jgi:thiol-disulfide isomerase/thioredoxin